MRKHSVRKWVHAICDLLPLLVIPIFALAVRSDNNYQPISIDTSGYEYVEKFTTNDIQNDHTYVNGNIYSIDLNYNSESLNAYFSNYDFLYFTFIHFEYNNETYYFIGDSTEQLYLANAGYFYIGSDRDSSSIKVLSSTVDIVTNWYDVGQDLQSCGVTLNSSDFNIFEREFVSGITYNDTDVGSQMVYTLYNTCDKYFNFNQVGTFADIYSWFETNIFGGTAPLSFFIVWNVILFEFIMDLIFLTYMVFMFVIDFTEHLIDGFFDKAYKGGKL